MNSKTIIILLVIIIILLGGVAYLYFAFYLPDTDRQAEQNLNLTEPVSSPEPAAFELGPEADYEPQPQGSFRYFLNLAKKYKQRDYCLKIEDAEQQNSCLAIIDDIIMQNPQLPKDCLAMSEQDKLDCLENLALAENDPEFCDYLTGQAQNVCRKTYVYDRIDSGDVSLCDLLVEAEQQRCLDIGYLNKALQTEDLSLCNNISDEQLKTACTEPGLL
jgi:hypothetical protein